MREAYILFRVPEVVVFAYPQGIRRSKRAIARIEALTEDTCSSKTGHSSSVLDTASITRK